MRKGMWVCVARTEPFLPEGDLFARACREIDGVRLAKVNACRREADRARSLCCGLILQYYVRRHLGTEKKAELLYGYGEYGKPYLADYPGIRFSLSHSGGYTAAVFADREAGIDIQLSRPLGERLVRRVLSGQEYTRYESLVSPAERADWFFRCWCAKESYVKLTGAGLAADFRRLVFMPERGRIVPEEAFREDGPGTEAGAVPAVCMEYRPGAGYTMNVCTAATEGEGPSFPEAAADITEELLKLCGPV